MLRESHFTVTFGIRVCVGLEFELTSGYQRLLEISGQKIHSYYMKWVTLGRNNYNHSTGVRISK